MKKKSKTKKPQVTFDKIRLLEQISEVNKFNLKLKTTIKYNQDLNAFSDPQIVLDALKSIREKYPEYTRIFPNPKDFKNKMLEGIYNFHF